MRYRIKLSENETEVEVANGVWEITREEHGHRWVTSVELKTTRAELRGENQITIDSQVLHSSLQIGQSPKKWITGIIDRGYFEHSDYVRHKKLDGKRGDYQYNLSLHMARDITAAHDTERALLTRFHIQWLEQKMMSQRYYHHVFGVIFDAEQRNEIFEMWKWNKEYLHFDPVERMEEQLAAGTISAKDVQLQKSFNSRITV